MGDTKKIPYLWGFIQEENGKFYVLDGNGSRFATADSLEEAKKKMEEDSNECCLDYLGEDSYFWQMTN